MFISLESLFYNDRGEASTPGCHAIRRTAAPRHGHFYDSLTSDAVINTHISGGDPYRIGPGTYVPLMFDPTGGGAWCAALCSTLLLHSLTAEAFP